ncbi:hypothetical protein L3Y34_000097 [Caenorhabditis briggsae]|uniref:Uncharacterized protein n=1 Tax=Caenorhabditis briggsae TaxID=6238 RepID=A0AAE9IL10_CAEBR|nr:hypothetical protein L3Y34_000097 [Caenorhabditis briggsae]
MLKGGDFAIDHKLRPTVRLHWKSQNLQRCPRRSHGVQSNRRLSAAQAHSSTSQTHPVDYLPQSQIEGPGSKKGETLRSYRPRHTLLGATQQTPRGHSIPSPSTWTDAAPSMSHQLCRHKT